MAGGTTRIGPIIAGPPCLCTRAAGNQEGRKSAIAVNVGVEMLPPTSVSQINLEKFKNTQKT
jgi:hypothetical protein